MMTTNNFTLSAEMIEKLKIEARTELAEDDVEDDEYFNPDDAAGGNFDDAYSMGVDAGSTYLAREILESLGISWKE
jgi:hypothetical protein